MFHLFNLATLVSKEKYKMVIDDDTGIFEREFFIESTSETLNIKQKYIGDVGCVVWDAGIALGKYLDRICQMRGANDPENLGLQGKVAIELGSGTGIVGLTAAVLGADVILTDLDVCIPLLDINIKSNASVLKGKVQAKELKWGQNVSEFPNPDIILVADCVYYEESLEPLISTLINLSGHHTSILLSYEEREDEKAVRLLGKFLDLLNKNFDVDEVKQQDQHPEYQSDEIHILKITNKSS